MTVQDLARELLNLSLTCGRPVSSLLAELETELVINGEYYKQEVTALAIIRPALTAALRLTRKKNATVRN